MNELPAEFWHGVAQFNQGEYYACHDTLEALWTEANEPERTFFQGLLQLAVALYHLSNHNQRGAVLLLGEGCRRLSAYAPSYGGIELELVLNQAQALLSTLQQPEASPPWPGIQIPIHPSSDLIST